MISAVGGWKGPAAFAWIDALAHAKRFTEAADEYRNLLRVATPTDKPEIQLAYAEALHHSGQDREVKALLNSVDTTSPEIAAHRFWDIGELQRAANEDDLEPLKRLITDALEST